MSGTNLAALLIHSLHVTCLVSVYYESLSDLVKVAAVTNIRILRGERSLKKD